MRPGSCGPDGAHRPAGARSLQQTPHRDPEPGAGARSGEREPSGGAQDPRPGARTAPPRAPAAAAASDPAGSGALARCCAELRRAAASRVRGAGCGVRIP